MLTSPPHIAPTINKKGKQEKDEDEEEEENDGKQEEKEQPKQKPVIASADAVVADASTFMP